MPSYFGNQQTVQYILLIIIIAYTVMLLHYNNMRLSNDITSQSFLLREYLGVFFTSFSVVGYIQTIFGNEHKNEHF